MVKRNRSNKNREGGKSLQWQSTAHNVTPYSAMVRRSTRLSVGTGDGSNNDDVGIGQLMSPPEQTVVLNSPPEQTSSTLCDAELKRGGVDPESNLRVRNCICSTPDQCREIMWEYAKMGKKDMFPYLKLPGQPKDDKSTTQKHAIAVRKNIYHHLYGKDRADIVQLSTGDERIALIHFHPNIRRCLHERREIKQYQYKWRVPLKVGKECGLTDADLCKTADADGKVGTTFFASPTSRRDLDDARTELTEAKRQYNEELAAENPSVHQEGVPVSGRRNPRARDLNRYIREASSNPRAAGLERQKLEDELMALQSQLKEREKEDAAKELQYKKALDEQHKLFTDRLISEGGLNRRTLVSDAYHAEKPWLSKYLYGRLWREHKAIASSCFGVHVKRVDTASGLLSPHITAFEKYSISVMVCKRDFEQHAFAAIYNRDRSSISKYTTEWMPKLGKVGGNMSELDLVLDHNYVLDNLNGKGVAYFVDGVPHRDGKPIDICAEYDRMKL